MSQIQIINRKRLIMIVQNACKITHKGISMELVRRRLGNTSERETIKH